MEQLEREERQAHRVLSVMTAGLTALAVILLVLDGWLAYKAFHPGPSGLGRRRAVPPER